MCAIPIVNRHLPLDAVPTLTSAFILEVREIDHFLREDKQTQPPASIGVVIDGS